MMWYFVVTMFLTSPSVDGVQVMMRFRDQGQCHEALKNVRISKISSSKGYSWAIPKTCSLGAFGE